MRLFVLFLLITAVLAGMRTAWTADDPDPWARAARRLRPLLLEIEEELRGQGRDDEADRVAACARTVSGWAAGPSA